MASERDKNDIISTAIAKLFGLGTKTGVNIITTGKIDFSDLAGDVVESFVELILTKRSKNRISAAQKFALDNIRILESEGYTPRTDILLNDHEYSVKDEILEDMFKKVMNQHQEKKIKYITNAVVNFFYEKDNVRHTSEFVFNALKIADNLTFQQMCLLELFSNDGYRNTLRDKEHEGVYHYSDAGYNLYNEILELVRLGLLCRAKEDVIENWIEMNHWEVDYVNTIDDIIPYYMVPTYFGSSFYKLLGLNDIEDDEIQQILRSGDLTTTLFD